MEEDTYRDGTNVCQIKYLVYNSLRVIIYQHITNTATAFKLRLVVVHVFMLLSKCQVSR